MKVLQIIKYLWPIIQLLIKLYKPKIIHKLEELHDHIDEYFTEEDTKLSSAKENIKKAELFDQQAEEKCKEHGVHLEESEINLVREIVHKKCELKRRVV